jgi:hypothetical protein
MTMQDKYAIGPVTLVKLVGLASSPRITSANADGAVRAADHPPPSAAAGLGGKQQQPVVDIASSYFSLKTTQSLGLSADPLRGHISFEPGVDRPVAGDGAPAQQFDPSVFDNLSNNPNSTDTGADTGVGRETASAGQQDIVDGAKLFSDDPIVDFTIVAGDASLADSVTVDVSVSSNGFDFAPASAMDAIETQLPSFDHFATSVDVASGTDAIPVI